MLSSAVLYLVLISTILLFFLPIFLCRQESQKQKSRDAARSRRGQQNDEFLELANQLPINPSEGSQLDRLSVMRLANSYVKIKNILNCLENECTVCFPIILFTVLVNIRLNNPYTH